MAIQVNIEHMLILKSTGWKARCTIVLPAGVSFAFTVNSSTMGLNVDKGVLKSAIVADDHAIVREGVINVLTGLGNVTIVSEADNGLSAIAEVKKHKPDLLVLDAAMPLAKGIEVYSEARRWSPNTRIVLFTGFTSLGLLADWLDAGVDGLLLKSCASSEIAAAFTAVLDGKQYVSNEVQKMLKSATAKKLTGRERQVLSLIATGNANSAIADNLHISPKTVEKHRASLMAKLGVHSISELMAYALREGLLDEHKQL